MEKMRKPFQGVRNILRFNWHFYAVAFLVIVVTTLFSEHFPRIFLLIPLTIAMLMSSSLIISCYIYDFSSLYSLDWLPILPDKSTLINIHAGFDETSELLNAKFSSCQLQAVDFYDPHKHTEWSIKRARKAYPPYPNTLTTSTQHLPFEDQSIDCIFVLLAAHEIRHNQERILFFRELNRTLRPNGQIIVTEHIRNLPNFLAYTIGFFHFFPKKIWINTFHSAQLELKSEKNITPFITSFTLQKNGNTP